MTATLRQSRDTAIFDLIEREAERQRALIAAGYETMRAFDHRSLGLIETLRTLRLHLARLRRLAADDPARLAASAAEHADIADAVGSGAADLAEATTRVHLHHAFHHLTRRGRAEETPTLLTPTEGDRP